MYDGAVLPAYVLLRNTRRTGRAARRRPPVARLGVVRTGRAGLHVGRGLQAVIATAPLLVLLYDRTFLAGSFKAALRRRWGLYAGLAATWVVLAVLLHFSPPLATIGRYHVSEYALTQPGVILYYLRLALVPYRSVSTMNGLWPIQPPESCPAR